MKSLLLLLAMLFTCEAFAFAPTNNFWLPDYKNISGITEDEFNEVIDTIVDIYRPKVELAGATLNVNKQWLSGVVNASAVQYGSYWVLNLYGGLARFNGMSKDAYAGVVCHEVGHHLGGAPMYTQNGIEQWASCEGQSDYFSGKDCLKLYFKKMYPIEQEQEQEQGQQYVDMCKEIYLHQEDQVHCNKGLKAGVEMTSVLAALSSQPTPSLDTHDETEVYETNQTGYPSVQCRLDTYRAGTYCDNKICDDYLTKRPACWYKD